MKADYQIVADLMRRKNVTEYRVSKDLGFSPSMFQRWKNGDASPKIDKVKKLADYFDVPLNCLYDDDTR